MTQGYSGSYSINGVTTLYPTQGKWTDRELLGMDGNGRPIYPPIGEFEMSWQLMSTSDLKKLVDAYNAVISTGTAVVDLPKWGNVDYLFYSYSGTFVSRPVVGAYFAEHVEDVRLIITNIRTD